MELAGVSITYDRCGPRMPGNEAEAAGLQGAYLDSQRANASAGHG
jgi:hypothetical protein